MRRDHPTGELLGGDLAPLTDEVGFLSAEASRVADALRSNVSERDVDRRRVAGSLRICLEELLPLSRIGNSKLLVVPTTGEWSAVFGNWWRGADVKSAISSGCRELRCGGMVVAYVENTAHKDEHGQRGRYGNCLFSVRGPSDADPGRSIEIRKVHALNDGARWDFYTDGDPLPFEEPDRYSRRRKAERFDLEMLRRYSAASGVFPFEESFFEPHLGAFLIEGPGYEPVELLEARATW